jgi:hypothetical protein
MSASSLLPIKLDFSAIPSGLLDRQPKTSHNFTASTTTRLSDCFTPSDLPLRNPSSLTVATSSTPKQVDWQPYADSPQARAYESTAHVIGYGGAAGGGKTDLMLGKALTKHRRAVIFRREAAQLTDIVDRSREIIEDAGNLNETKLIWRGLPGKRVLLFAGLKDEEDWRKQKGRARDFMGFDEATEFTELQIRTLLTWNRTTVSGQACCAVLGFNPPSTVEQRWIITFFAPWLDGEHPNPAEPGELRWYATLDGEEVERPDGEPFTYTTRDGRVEDIEPRSRTFFPALVTDNPVFMANGYVSQLQGLPEPLRSQMLYGDMHAGEQDDEWQCIPTAWVRAAQARWTAQNQAYAGPLSAIGVDVARGGQDDTVLVRRYGAYFAMPDIIPGRETHDGATAAAPVLLALGNDYQTAQVHIDVIGAGGSVYDILKQVPGAHVTAVNGSNKAPGTDRSGKLKFTNMRARDWWRMREALDPMHGDGLALPPHPRVERELCAPKWEKQKNGIKIEDKDEVKKRLGGKSPDVGDALVLARRDLVPVDRTKTRQVQPAGRQPARSRLGRGW